ncbi:MAG: GNAT family N-acetyltransferase [Ornithinimicrobium sp.]|uniref:GNAT family N-acetyltransferase n=1 Tax=Ornithinimicrobium sp. TaxID=1977084 RepID=UPI003D9B8FF6
MGSTNGTRDEPRSTEPVRPRLVVVIGPIASGKSTLAYVQAAADKPSYLATQDGHVIGVALVQRHTPLSAELHLIAVGPDARGRGVGSSSVEAIETDLRQEGVRLFEAKTVGESHQDEGYAATLILVKPLE